MEPLGRRRTTTGAGAYRPTARLPKRALPASRTPIARESMTRAARARSRCVLIAFGMRLPEPGAVCIHHHLLTALKGKRPADAAARPAATTLASPVTAPRRHWTGTKKDVSRATKDKLDQSAFPPPVRSLSASPCAQTARRRADVSTVPTAKFQMKVKQNVYLVMMDGVKIQIIKMNV